MQLYADVVKAITGEAQIEPANFNVVFYLHKTDDIISEYNRIQKAEIQMHLKKLVGIDLAQARKNKDAVTYAQGECFDFKSAHYLTIPSLNFLL